MLESVHIATGLTAGRWDRRAGVLTPLLLVCVVLVATPPALAGSAAGLSTVSGAPAAAPAAMSCGAGDEALASGRTQQAKRDYEALGESKCATRGLAAIQECELGDAYRRLDDRGEAMSAYKAALVEEPRATCASAGISLSEAPWPSSWISWFEDALPPTLVAAGAVLVLLFLVMLGGYWRPLRSVLRRLPITRTILSPRLTIGAIDDSAIETKVGVAISAQIKERLQRFREEALRGSESDYELDRGTGEEEFADLVSGDSGLKNALDNARELSEQTKTIAALLDILYGLLPIERLTVTGALSPPAAKRASATLALEHDATLNSTVSLAGPPCEDTPAGSDYVALSEQAAAWVQFAVARTLSSKPVTADEAESYALVQLGLGYELSGSYQQARAAFMAALALSSRNWAARVNLATTEARLGEDPQTAIEVLREGLSDMTGRPA